MNRRQALLLGAKAVTVMTAMGPITSAAQSVLNIPESTTLTPKVTDNQNEVVLLNWLDRNVSSMPVCVSWGVPWAKGRVKRNQRFILSTEKGEALPLQNWPLAYWPDGSVKFMGFATVASPNSGNSFRLSLAKAVSPVKAVVEVKEQGNSYVVNTGVMQCAIAKSGTNIFDSMIINGNVVANYGQLVCLLQNGADDSWEKSPQREKYLGEIEQVVIEQSGPVRAVFKISGRHKAAVTDRKWLPFVVRLYFYAGQESVRLVHSIVFDGDQNKDFIGGLGITFKLPMREEVHNRHVRFSGEGQGVWGEPVQPLIGKAPMRKGNGVEPYNEQLAGRRVQNRQAFDEKGQKLMADWAVWSDFKLTQLSPDSFSIKKRTSSQSAWINVDAGSRSSGMAFLGDVSGGLGVGLKNFWQSYPSSLEVRNAASSDAELSVWLWSPEGPLMDMRHYDTRLHSLEATYEDPQQGYNTPYGVARTSELTLFPRADVLTRDNMASLASICSQPPMLVCTPEYYYSCSIFGHWGLPDRSTPMRRQLEDQLDLMFDFYSKQVEDHRWYGFWDYGDIMHTYDPLRHTWKYDVGGYAWMNSEEMPDMWLWYSFLRTGRPEVFRMAEAMTRHTQEVDVYHLGFMAGLGSRHNVRHWGDGSKELRISQSFLKRFYYYLSTDERVGDLMHDETNADLALLEIDPLRKILPKGQYPTHVRTGPDWLAAAGNWMTEWERTEDTKFRDKIITGMKALASMPKRLLTSLSFGYDPKTSMIYDVPEKMPIGQFIMIMGGAEVAFELETLMDVPEWSAAWLELCETWASAGGGDMAGPRAIAYIARKKNDPELGRLAWQEMSKEGDGTGLERFPTQFKNIAGSDVVTPKREVAEEVATGHLSQWALNIIETLELAGEWLPK